MDFRQLVVFVLQASIFLTVLGFGLANFPQESRVVAAALLYLLVNVTISIAYIVRMRLKSA